MTARAPVLVSWVAVNNDPFERERGKASYVLADGAPVPGPTLTLLFDEESPWAGQMHDVVLLHRKAAGKDGERERRAVDETVDELQRRQPELRIHLEPWQGEDPTDHGAIFEFLRAKLPELRRRFAGHELVLHISPGTPSMQTVWVLMGETGFIEPPFRLVKSIRREERRSRPAVVPVEVGIETFYKVYKATRPREIASADQSVVPDPARFRTERMRRLFDEARRFAHVNVPVLLLGERGTGKTTLASWIRSLSPFRKESLDACWPAVACGQYSPETMRAELFGHKKGAFTGATSDKEGLLAAADGDTLFLDEVGDVSRDLQRLLIKALEEKQYLPLGHDKPRHSRFRLLTATNLEDRELRERLDPDFLDRISLLTLRLPALREVSEELGWMWEQAYVQAAARSGAGASRAQLGRGHHERIVAELERHPLPGNLRELFRVAYRVVAARCDPHAPLSPADAVEYGLAALTEGDRPGAEEALVTRSAARAFGEARPLDALIEEVGSLPTRELERDLKAYLAAELRRVASSRGVPVESLCDVSGRTLQSWLSDGRKKPSGSGKTSSDSNE